MTMRMPAPRGRRSRFNCPGKKRGNPMTTKHGTKTILVVDDDPDFLIQQETILKAAGYDVVTACNRVEGEARLTEQPPDAVIADLMMDETDDGFILCYAAKKKDPAMPVILVTSVASETGIEFDAATDEERSWIKADVLLAKPIRPEQIVAELKRLLKD
ncbi:MAG TPA: response regulator [Phycisphaerales bacterium]|nr:response regulator [Phycisphaerales bacterium]